MTCRIKRLYSLGEEGVILVPVSKDGINYIKSTFYYSYSACNRSFAELQQTETIFQKRHSTSAPSSLSQSRLLSPLTIKYTYSQWSTSQRLDEPTVRERSARSTPPIRLPSTRRERTLWPHRERGDMTVSHIRASARIGMRGGVIVRGGVSDSEVNYRG